MNPLLDEHARDLLDRLVAPVTAGPVRLAEIEAEAARRRARRRRARLAIGASAAAVVVAGAATLPAIRDSHPETGRATDSTPSAPASPTATSPPTGVRDPAGVIGRLQGSWTLRLTNIAPDGLGFHNELMHVRVEVSFRDDVLSTSDGVHAIEARVLADVLAADETADLNVYDVRTASATAAPGDTDPPPPILETLSSIAHVSFQGDEVMLSAANYGIIAVLSRA